MNFDAAFSILVNPDHEGGYTNDPQDPGGETKYGISKRSYPGEDIANLTLDRAKQLYQRDFWGPSGCDAVPDKLKYEMFDMGVNTGPKEAVRVLQRALGAVVDGDFGPNTVLRATSCDPQWLLRRVQAFRIRYYTGLPREEFEHDGAGWMNRIAANMLLET